MATAVELPQLGNTVEECRIVRWVRRTGDTVRPGDIVAEIETDKTTFEVPAPAGGTMLETFFEEGAIVKVFTTICVIGMPGERTEAFNPHHGARSANGDVPAAESASRRADGGARMADRGPAVLSPRARRFAAAHGFDPVSVAGSGPGGRVLERDVQRAYESEAQPAASAASNLRSTIARRMRESLASTAQYTLHASAGAAGLLALRARVRSAAAAPDITINDLIAFCTMQALRETPDLNAEYVGGRLVKHAEVHIAFAVDTPRGLLAPVVRNAHTLTVQDLAARMKELAGRAVDGSIDPDDLTGATFTISNLGSLGIESFTPVINLPQVAILGVGAIQLKPVRAAGGVEFVDTIGLSLTCDHQAIDGAPGARFLRVLREKIESVESIVKM